MRRAGALLNSEYESLHVKCKILRKCEGYLSNESLELALEVVHNLTFSDMNHHFHGNISLTILLTISLTNVLISS